MAGYAKTKQVMLSTATVMVGKPEDLHKLNPAEHSLGLVKNFQITADPTYVELTQGIKNTTVMSVKNSDGVRCSMEVYEYTAQNLAYGGGLDGSVDTLKTVDTIWLASAAYDDTAHTISVDGLTAGDLEPGDYIFMQTGFNDHVHIARIASVTDDKLTLAAGYEPSDTMTFPIGTRVGKVHRLDIGGEDVQPEFAAKVVGFLPVDKTPFTILLPKIKITKGLGISFQSDNFGNLPFEFTPYGGVPTDPFYSHYGEAAAILFPR